MVIGYKLAMIMRACQRIFQKSEEKTTEQAMMEQTMKACFAVMGCMGRSDARSFENCTVAPKTQQTHGCSCASQ
jgi:hypothetical protein